MTKPSNTGRRELVAVVLAAGRGTRFPDIASKVLAKLNGKPLIAHVLDSVFAIEPDRVIVVVGHGKESVQAAVSEYPVIAVDQGEPRGTGHAVLATASAVGREPVDLLILNGDVPLVKSETLAELTGLLAGSNGALLTRVLDDAGAYGRIIRNGEALDAIVEAADADEATLEIREVNVGTYAFRSPAVFDMLAAAGDDNAQGEIYLTDVVRGLTAAGKQVVPLLLADPRDGSGVNSAEELQALEDGATS